MPMLPNNRTVGPSEGEKHFLSFFSIICLLSSLLGNPIILIASIKYNAIKLNRFIVVFIQNIAAAELVSTLFYNLPGTISLLADDWMFGNSCPAIYTVGYYSWRVATHLLCVMVVSKVLTVRYPLRTIALSKRRAKKIAAAVWTFCLIYPAFKFVLRYKIYFDYRIFNCGFCTANVPPIWVGVMVTVASLLSLIIFVATIILVISARKMTRRKDNLKWQGVLTVIVTAGLYTLSILPIPLYSLANYFVFSKHQTSLDPIFFRIAMNTVCLISIWNFWVYCFTIASFKKFLLDKMKLAFSKILPPKAINLSTERSKIVKRENECNAEL